MDIICRYGGLKSIAVVVRDRARPQDARRLAGRPLKLKAEANEALTKGCENFAKQIENLRFFGLPVVVTSIASRSTATRGQARRRGGHCGRRRGRSADEVTRWAKTEPRRPSSSSRRWSTRAATSRSSTRSTLPSRRRSRPSPPRSTAPTVWNTCRGQGEDKQFTDQGLGKLPLCMAKTHLTLTHDPTLKGRPRGFPCRFATSVPPPAPGTCTRCSARCARCRVWPSRPAAVDVDIDVETGRIIGLFERARGTIPGRRPPCGAGAPRSRDCGSGPAPTGAAPVPLCGGMR